MKLGVSWHGGRTGASMVGEIVGRPMEILLVEDDLQDAGLTIETLKESPVPCRVSLVCDGEEASEFLQRLGRYAQAPRPDLILLDLHLPKRDGREVLAEVRADRLLQRIPVIVLTASEAHREILGEDGLHVESYLVKPVDPQQFVGVVRSLRRYLLADVVVPQ
jgi:two-component system, chemotaxis family, response regulator Rcp1